MALRRAHRPDRRKHFGRPAEWHAFMAFQADPGPDLAARGIRPFARGARGQGRGRRADRQHEQHPAANADDSAAADACGFGPEMTVRGHIFAVILLPLSACNRFQNSLGGDGADGAHFVSLFTFFMVVCTLMYVTIVGAFLIGLWRARRNAEPLAVDEGK